MEESATRTKALTGWRPPPRHGPKAVQALRITASSLAAFGLAQAIALPQGFWAVITALIVTQSNVGGSLKAALDRFIGSVLGAVYGSAVAFAIPHEHGLSRAAALVIAVAPLSFMAALSAGFRVAPITAIIVLLSISGSTLGPFGFAVDRVLEVGLGCAVGLVVSVLIVPARASRLVLETATQVMRLLAEQLEALASLDDQAQADLGALAVKTRQSLSKLETLVGEAARTAQPACGRARSRPTIPDLDALASRCGHAPPRTAGARARGFARARRAALVAHHGDRRRDLTRSRPGFVRGAGAGTVGRHGRSRRRLPVGAGRDEAAGADQAPADRCGLAALRSRVCVGAVPAQPGRSGRSDGRGRIRTPAGRSRMTRRSLDQRLRLPLLRAVDAVDAHGSLLKASAVLGVTQPALTKSLQELEDIVQARLFDRHSRGMRT